MTERRSSELTDDDLGELLPWFATGKTTAEETRAIERALAESPALRAELEMVRRERAVEVETTQAVGDPNPAIFERVLAQLDGARQFKPVEREGHASGQPGLLARLFGLVPNPTILRVALAVACVAIVAEGVAIARLSVPVAGTFQTASAPDQSVAGPRVIVRFQPNAGIAAANALIGEISGSIVKGPMPDGAYVVALPQGTDADAAIAQLRQHGDLVAGADRGS
jgi:hypothetical protein